MFKTINRDITSEIVEKKSKFIANIFYVETVEEAEEKIKEIKKKYFDARHNCFAFSIYTKNGIVNRFSDDGEPSGTAGSPMLNILTSKNLTNVVVVVTRYFGGILLGTGGLVRAYTGAMQEGLNNIEEIYKDIGLEIQIEIVYSDLEKCKYYLKQNNIGISDIKYEKNILLTMEITKEKLDKLEENKNNLNFKILSQKYMGEKYVEIQNI